MPIHTLQTIPQEPEETSFFSGLLEGLALDSGESPARLALHFCLLSVTFYTFYLALGPAGILVAAVIILLRRYLRSRPRRRAGRRRRRTGPDGQNGVRNGWTARTACAPYLSLLD